MAWKPVRSNAMKAKSESSHESYVRVTPTWLRVGVWVSITFLTMSVILGMLLY